MEFLGVPMSLFVSLYTLDVKEGRTCSLNGTASPATLPLPGPVAAVHQSMQ
jgi:hypothetical protein